MFCGSGATGKFERYFGFDFSLEISGPRATKSAGSNAIVSFPFLTCIILSSFTLPRTEHWILNLSQILLIFERLSGLAITSILSWDSDIIISSGAKSDSRRCTFFTSNSIPIPKLSAVSDIAQDNPPPPKSFIALMQF